MRNKLLPPPQNSLRCTGRTTAIALSLVTQALQSQGVKCGAFDHNEPGDSTSSAQLLQVVRHIITSLGLLHIVSGVEAYSGKYKVTVVSEIWEK